MRDFTLAASAQAIVDEFFLDSAEEDYLTARWAAQTYRLHQYCWSASQAIEKCSKAILLKLKVSINGNDGHNIIGLIEENLLEYLPSEIKTSLPLKAVHEVRFGEERLHPQSTIAVLEHFQNNGKPSSRYRSTPQSKVFFSEIHLLDAIFSMLRTLAGRPIAIVSDSEFQLLTDQPEIRLFKDRFPKLASGRAANALMVNTLAHQNIEFFPELFMHEKPLIGGLSVRNNSWAIKKSNAVFSQDSKEQEDLEWVKDNVRLSREDKEELRKMAAIYQSRLGEGK